MRPHKSQFRICIYFYLSLRWLITTGLWKPIVSLVLLSNQSGIFFENNSVILWVFTSWQICFLDWISLKRLFYIDFIGFVFYTISAFSCRNLQMVENAFFMTVERKKKKQFAFFFFTKFKCAIPTHPNIFWQFFTLECAEIV